MAITPERLAQLRKELWGPWHQELIDEIDQLTRKLAEARAACAATLPLLRRCQEFLNLNLDALAGRSHCAEILNALADVWYEGDLVLPNLGQSLLDDNARLLAVVDKLPKTEQFQRRGKETDHAETDHV